MPIDRRESLRKLVQLIYLPTFHAYWSGTIVLLAYFFGQDYLRPSSYTSRLFGHAGEPFNNWDGQWYHYIAAHGYFYDRAMASSVNFFPAFPLIARALSTLSGLSTDASLAVVSNTCFLAMLIVLGHYVTITRGKDHPELVGTTLIAACIYPASLFFRMGYTESLFALILITVLVLMASRAPLAAIAAVIGLATATRSVGIGLLPAFALHAWQRSRGPAQFVGRMALLTPLACWGIVAYMVYLHATFGDPLAWAKTQDHFKIRPTPPLLDKLQILGSLEPLLERFTPGSGVHWSVYEAGKNPLFGMHLADVVLFAGAAALTLIGFARRLLTPVEFLASAFLILIPYGSIGYECSMRGFARYSSVVLPVYIVIGTFLARSSAHLVACCYSISAILFYIYTCKFLSNYQVI